MADIKWSAFSTVTSSTSGDTLVGLHSGNNYQFLLTSTPTATAVALWDANKNLRANSFMPAFATTATAAATTTLVVGSAYIQEFTGSTTQIVSLPVTSTLTLGQGYYIINDSSGVVTVNSSGGNLVQAMAAGTSLWLTCISTSLTTAAAWQSSYISDTGGSVASGLINQLAWYSATGNTVSGLTIVNSAGLTTTSGGVPTWVAYTGSGAPVLANTPTLITPNIGAATGTTLTTTSTISSSGGALVSGASSGSQGTLLLWSPITSTGFLVVQPQANSGNYQNTLQNAVTTAARSWTLPDATGTIALTSGGGALSVPSITFTTTSGIIGTTTNNSAAAGSVGEIISSNIVQVSAVSVSSGTNNDITSISLTAGDWDVYGNIYYIIAGGAMVQYFQGWVNNASATSPDGSFTTLDNYGATGLALVLGQAGQVVPSRRFSLSTTTSIYLSCAPGFTVGTMTACGAIFARRRR